MKELRKKSRGARIPSKAKRKDESTALNVQDTTFTAKSIWNATTIRKDDRNETHQEEARSER